ncbi:MAG: hypothetical protein M0R77_02845 [Gammaproteobacteria bacterium]|nr:hypothetical protein [Gammaproteobacteria bacterium]
MQYFSSTDPLYTIFFSNLSAKEREEVMSWCRENLTGQMIIIGGNSSSINIKGYTKPIHNVDHFGRQNGFAEKADYASTIIGFTEQSDLTAFRIMFENQSKD